MELGEGEPIGRWGQEWGKEGCSSLQWRKGRKKEDGRSWFLGGGFSSVCLLLRHSAEGKTAAGRLSGEGEPRMGAAPVPHFLNTPNSAAPPALRYPQVSTVFLSIMMSQHSLCCPCSHSEERPYLPDPSAAQHDLDTVRANTHISVGSLEDVLLMTEMWV